MNLLLRRCVVELLLVHYNTNTNTTIQVLNNLKIKSDIKGRIAMSINTHIIIEGVGGEKRLLIKYMLRKRLIKTVI